MTVRGGGNPRRFVGRPGSGRDQGRTPVVDNGFADDGYLDPADTPGPASGVEHGLVEPRDAYRLRHSGGGRHILRFAVFALVLASLVIGGLLFVVRPIAMNALTDWAAENPTALQVPFVAGLVRDGLGPSLTSPAGTDPTPMSFVVTSGETPRQIADALVQAGLLKDARAGKAFVFESIQKGVTSSFLAGKHVLNKTMTPDQIIAALLVPPPADPTVKITFREGLRIEQMVVKIEAVEQTPDDPAHPLKLDPKQFYDLAMHPPASLTSKYTWLKQGVSLEGFLFPATYTVSPDVTADELLSMMLDAFQRNAPPALLKLTPDRIYRTLQLASLTELEVNTDADRPLVAGVYTNRLDPKKWPTGLLNSNPSVTYAIDSVWLRGNPIASWIGYTFWVERPSNTTFDKMTFPADLAGYNTYRHAGLTPTPICSPSLASIQAALAPNTKDGYLYFLATPDGKVLFAHTHAEQLANEKKYGLLP